MKRILTKALLLMVFTICYMPSAQAFTFTDDFSNGINSYWWTATANGNSIDATGGNVTMSQNGGASVTGATLGFNFSVTGDFTAQVDFSLNGLIPNGERIGLMSGFGGVERIMWNATNDWQLYLTHFPSEPGQLAGHTTTSDISGKLQLSRTGSTLSGSYWNSTVGQWILIHSFTAAPNQVDTDLSLSIWNWLEGASNGAIVTFDNFSLNAPAMVGPAPVPIPAAVWLLGSGLTGLIGIRRFRK